MIFSLREDYLARLDEARGDLPGLLGDSRRLIALDRAQRPRGDHRAGRALPACWWSRPWWTRW